LQCFGDLLNVHGLLQFKVTRFDAGIQSIVLQIALEQIGIPDQLLRLQPIGDGVQALTSLNSE
jgi:hypothetical protein